jgi:hypothetical protein
MHAFCGIGDIRDRLLKESKFELMNIRLHLGIKEIEKCQTVKGGFCF